MSASFFSSRGTMGNTTKPTPMGFEAWMEKAFPEIVIEWDDCRYTANGKGAEWYEVLYREAVKGDLRKWRFWLTGEVGFAKNQPKEETT